VVVHDLNLVRIAVTPGEADAPLVIDPNAIRPRPFPFEQFQLASGRDAKILQPECPIQVQKLPPRRPFDGLKPPNPAVLKERRGVGALARPDQIPVYDVEGIMSNVITGKEGWLWRKLASLAGKLASRLGRLRHYNKRL
jgi:hypothetical protein